MSTPAVGRLVAASIGPATHRAYRGALARLAAWCSPGCTLDDATLATYLGSRSIRRGSRRAVAEQVIAAVRFQARVRWRAQAGGTADRTRAGWVPPSGCRTGPRSGLAGLRDAALLAVASDALLRTSEIAGLDVADIDDAEHTVKVRRSKTDQAGAGAALYLGPPTLARARRDGIDAAGIGDDGPPVSRDHQGRVSGPRAALRARGALASITACAAAGSTRPGVEMPAACGWPLAINRCPPPGPRCWRCSPRPAGDHRPCRGAVAKLRYGA